VLNAANEVAVAAFLEERIGFMDVPRVVRDALGAVPPGDGATLESVLDADARAREAARRSIEGAIASSA
jgi:1-deoxy-D-xylulose-5-phosphate reductoisomerase